MSTNKLRDTRTAACIRKSAAPECFITLSDRGAQKFGWMVFAGWQSAHISEHHWQWHEKKKIYNIYIHRPLIPMHVRPASLCLSRHDMKRDREREREKKGMRIIHNDDLVISQSVNCISWGCSVVEKPRARDALHTLWGDVAQSKWLHQRILKDLHEVSSSPVIICVALVLRPKGDVYIYIYIYTRTMYYVSVCLSRCWLRLSPTSCGLKLYRSWLIVLDWLLVVKSDFFCCCWLDSFISFFFSFYLDWIFIRRTENCTLWIIN